MQNHYDFIKSDKDFVYLFTTKNAIRYRVAFLDDHTFNTISETENYNTIYQIVIEKLDKIREPLDAKVSETIIKIVHDFLMNFPFFIIYYCSHEDDKELKRFNSFNRWYDRSQEKMVIERSINIMKISGQIIYSALMFHRENPLRDEILLIYDSMESILNAPK